MRATHDLRRLLRTAAFVAASGSVALVACTAVPGCSFRNLDDLTSGDAAPPPDAAPQCKQDCLGGACVLGKCQPVTLIDGRVSPWGIALDSARGDVYWSELGPPGVAGAIFRLVPGAVPSAASYVVTDVDPTWLFASSGRLYWTSETQPYAVGRCPIPGAGCTYHPGSSATPPGSIVASGFGTRDYVNNPDRVVADASGVYWTNAGSSVSSRDGSIVVCRATGCGSPPPQQLALFQSHPRGIAVDETYVYWVNQGLGVDPMDGAVLRIPKVPSANSTAEKIAEGLQSPAYVAVGADAIYWTNAGTGAIMMWPKTGGAPKVFADGQGGAWDIAVDDSGVYWTTFGPSGTVAMCPLSGCDAGVTIVAAVNSPYAIALDANAVYFTMNDPHTGAVKKVAKP